MPVSGGVRAAPVIGRQATLPTAPRDVEDGAT
jgi:hypothetical protein